MLAAAADETTTEDPPDTSDTESGDIFQRALASSGVAYAVRRGQQLPQVIAEEPVVYWVRDGTLLVQASLPSDRRAVLPAYYRGDLVWSLPQAAMPGEALLASVPSQVVRLRRSIFDDLLARQPALARAFTRQLQMRAARIEAHNIVIGRLGGEERLASYLVEVGRVRGAFNGRAVKIDLPFSRAQVADYLALNPDTLSRLVTRLRADDVVSFVGRRRVVVHDWPMLRERTPVADLLERIYAPDPAT